MDTLFLQSQKVHPALMDHVHRHLGWLQDKDGSVTQPGQKERQKGSHGHCVSGASHTLQAQLSPSPYHTGVLSYKYRDTTPDDTALNSDFVLRKEVDGSLKLKQNHVYYSQIQGQMAIGEWKWCDFVVYTTKGISIERIPFNSTFWESELLPKLTEFYTLCVAPEIVCPQHPVHASDLITLSWQQNACLPGVACGAWAERDNEASQ